jgi:uncharacterized protein YbbC (DUF1343 family)
VIAMHDWLPEAGPGFGWPDSRIWINPSPNAASLNMARAYAGTVMLEGTTLSEGGAPRARSKCCSARPTSMPGPCWPRWSGSRPSGWPAARLRECWFTPTFHKHAGQALQRPDDPCRRAFYDHLAFRPWRLQALAFKAIRRLYPDYPLSGATFPTSTSFDRLAIDVINGGPGLARMGR